MDVLWVFSIMLNCCFLNSPHGHRNEQGHTCKNKLNVEPTSVTGSPSRVSTPSAPFQNDLQVPPLAAKSHTSCTPGTGSGAKSATKKGRSFPHAPSANVAYMSWFLVVNVGHVCLHGALAGIYAECIAGPSDLLPNMVPNPKYTRWGL